MKSFIPWIGGKSQLAKKIISMFPEETDRYIEVFGGGASVLFSKEKHAPLEIYNDANSHPVNLFRCIRWSDKYYSAKFQWDKESEPAIKNWVNNFKNSYPKIKEKFLCSNYSLHMLPREY